MLKEENGLQTPVPTVTVLLMRMVFLGRCVLLCLVLFLRAVLTLLLPLLESVVQPVSFICIS